MGHVVFQSGFCAQALLLVYKSVLSTIASCADGGFSGLGSFFTWGTSSVQSQRSDWGGLETSCGLDLQSRLSTMRRSGFDPRALMIP